MILCQICTCVRSSWIGRCLSILIYIYIYSTRIIAYTPYYICIAATNQEQLKENVLKKSPWMLPCRQKPYIGRSSYPRIFGDRTMHPHKANNLHELHGRANELQSDPWLRPKKTIPSKNFHKSCMQTSCLYHI